MGVILTEINAIAELERYGFTYRSAGDDEVAVPCPFHDDHSPSCFVNIQKRAFKCQTASCGAHGDIINLLAKKADRPRAVVVKELSQRYDLEDTKLCDPLKVEEWHQNLISGKCDVLKNELYRRGVDDTLIAYYRWGVQFNTKENARVTIPIFNRSKNICNVRKYLPGAPGALKMKNAHGFGKVTWYPVEQLELYNTLVLTGGEAKAIVAAYELNAHGIGAFTATCGEDNIPYDMLTDLKGKRVIICMDVDEPGRKAAIRVATVVKLYADWVGILTLPLDTAIYPKGDINDFKVAGGQLYPLLEHVEEFTPEYVDRLTIDESIPEDLDLQYAIHADNSGKRIRLKGVVATLDTTPYLVPKDIVIKCTEDQDYCAICPIKQRGRREFTIPPESPSILEFVKSSTKQHLEIIKQTVGIPSCCRVCEHEKLREYNVEDVRIGPSLDVGNRSEARQAVPALVVGSGLSSNESYEFTGKLFADPNTQQATLLMSDAQPTKDALASFALENAQELGLFWPREWSVEACEEKLQHIYDDFSANVTDVRGRNDLHFVLDLLYHSPLLINFDGSNEKGWVEVMIIGDSDTGKSRCTEHLVKHYGLGSIVDCANLTPAGIIGGMEKIADRWWISWGQLPCSDQRALFMDEFMEAPPLVLPAIRRTRASGIATVTKIGRVWETRARTRLALVSNPLNKLKMHAYPYGVTAIGELAGTPQDVRRFDIAMVVTDKDVDRKIIDCQKALRPHVPHVHTSELCRKLVLWAWTRSREQVIFPNETVVRIMQESMALGDEFTDAVPLISKGSMRFKLARLAASVAARLFSCNDDYSSIVVLPVHVDVICRLLRRLYNSPACGYAEYTAAQKILDEILDPDLVERAICETKFPRELCRSMLAQDYIEPQDFADWCGTTLGEAQDLLSLFIRKYAMIRKRNYYRKTPVFINMLKRLQETLPVVARPSAQQKRSEF